MINSFLKYVLLVATITSFFFSCNNKDEPVPTGVVKGIVTDGTNSAAIAEVRIVLFDANTNEPTDNVTVTDAEGSYSFNVPGGSYFIKLSKQSYFSVPTQGISALPFTVTNGQELDNPVQMFPNTAANIGWISGKLSSSDAAISGCLVVATDGTNGYSTISDKEGNYVIYNVPSASYSVKAWKSGINSSEVNAAVTTNTETANVDLTLSATSGATVSGAITFLATTNIEVDVALIHPETLETIPGLSTMTSAANYSMNQVPDGTYLARATYANDGVVMDPDWIVKNGEPFVTVSGGAATRDFSVTGAVTVVSPTNEASSTIPVLSTSLPTFTWEAYPSTSDYVIEVMDAGSKVIWGGFSNDWTVKNIVIPSAQNSIQFNSDGNATEDLQSGKVYRWRIYASKDNAQATTGWELISVSEDQMGLIIIE